MTLLTLRLTLFFTGVVALIQGIVRLQMMFKVSKYWEESVEVSLVVAYFTSNVTFRMSIFLNMVIAVVRMYHIARPLHATANVKRSKIV